MSKSGKAHSHKKQHFVPQCYTKAWHDPAAPASPMVKPYVWVFNRDGSNPRRKAPANLFTETNIYTIKGTGGERDLQLEHGFQELEDKFTRIRNLKFNRREWPDAEQMIWLLTFVATAQARTAANRDHQREQWGGLRKRMEEMQTAYENASPKKREAMELMGRTSPSSDSGKGMTLDDVRVLEEHPIQQMIGIVVQSVMPVFQRMHVAVLCTDDPIGFVTSDHPCTWFDPESYKMQPIFRGPGLGSRTIEVTLPISPSQCLILTHDPQYQGYIDVPERVVNELNYRHIAHCNESFASCSQQTRPMWFEHRPMPDDAWEKVRARKVASGK